MTDTPSAGADTQPWTERHFAYLDKLRTSGATNMWGAAPYLQRRFGIDREAAVAILGAWMGTFDAEKTPAERALLAKAGAK